MTEPTYWYAIIIRPGKERDAADAFRKEGITAYWPNYNRQVRAFGIGRRRAILTTIIPGYIFIPTNEENGLWATCQRVPGFINVIRGFEGALLRVSQAEIDTIRAVEAGQNTPPPLKPVHNFKTGQKVRFVDDILSRWPPGKCIKALPNGKIFVEVYLMARMIPFVVFPHQIEAI